MPAKRRGFTMIEILVVIGVIAILVAMITMGVRSVIGGAKEKSTRMTLENLKSMLAEYEVVAKGLNRQPGGFWWNNNFEQPQNLDPPLYFNFWRDANPLDYADDLGNPTANPAVNPGLVTNDALQARYAERPGSRISDQIANTQIAMEMLLTAPNNKASIARLPPEQLMEAVPNTVPNTKLKLVSASDRRLLTPVVLDAWGNPILFVPAGGLDGVMLSAHGTEIHIITSGGMVEDADRNRPLPPNLRPFFASAGPDGAFGSLAGKDLNYGTADDIPAGDDNVYSFEN